MSKVRFSSLLTLLLLYAIAMPTFENSIGSIGAIFVNGVLGVVLFLFALYKRNEFINIINTNVPLKIVILALLTLEVLIVLSMFSGAFFNGVDLIIRDFFELHKPIFYVLTIVFSFYIFTTSCFSVEKLLLKTFVVISILGFIQILHYDEFSALYTGLNVVASNRLTIPFGNPYDLAFILLFFVFYFLMQTLYEKSFTFFLLTILALYLLVGTGSRSVSISFLVVFLLIYPFFILRLKIEKKIKRMALAGYISVIALFIVNIEGFIKSNPFISGQYVQFVESGSIGDSATVRLEQFMFSVDKSNEGFLIPLIGNGPSKKEMEHVESAYTYIYYRYGIIGFILYAFIYIYILVSLYKLIFRRTTHSNSIGHQPVLTSLFLWFLTMPVSAIGGMFIEQSKVSFFYYLMIGYVLSVKTNTNLKKY